MPEKNKRIRIMAGPNGSGKSTVLKEVRRNFYSGPFVNADEIERSFNEKGLVNLAAEFSLEITDESFQRYINNEGISWLKKAANEGSSINIECKESILLPKGAPNPYDAALAADFIRHELLNKGETFTFETVLSHPSKVEFLKKSNDAGFKNYLYFICTVSPKINIERVKQRVHMGGHHVKEERIEKRYYESLNVLSELIPLCYRCYFFDNSSKKRSIEPVAVINPDTSLEIKVEELPWWIEEYIIDKLFR
jgi:predicted ABC-type ATPase